MKTTAIFLAWLLMMVGVAAHAGDVGFQRLTIGNGGDKPLTIGIWYPTKAAASLQPLQGFTQTVAAGAPASGERLPLVVMSHGTGGWFGEHYDTALALARAGFVVAAVNHTGDTYDDTSRRLQIWQRPGHIHRLIDYLLAEWPEHRRIDPRRIGVFGFSAGGFTALVAAGGTPDLTQVQPHCARMPKAFECSIVGKLAPAELARQFPPASGYVHDARIRAAVVAAPALGFAFGRQGLAAVTIPVQLWRAEDDQVLPNPDYAQAVRDTLPRRPEYHVVAGADHYDFLAPCSAVQLASAPEICADQPGFDRPAFHASFNEAVVRFFQRALR